MSTVVRAWLIAVVLGAGTLALRSSFLLLAGRVAALPQGAREALRMIPAAALAALVAPALLRPEGGALQPLSPQALAGLLALLVAWRTRSAVLTILVGLVAVALLEAIL